MNIVPSKPLQVVSASAGSGKTYNLVFQYLLLLYKNPSKDTFRKIVAMTFTNKAALEMKTRVISSLETLAFPESFDAKDRKYEGPLLKNLNISPQLLHSRGKLILKSILHRYEDFMLLTIDKFNLKLLRSFSRDLDMAGDFEVIIDTDLLMQKVLDQMMTEIGTENHQTLTKLALNFAESQTYEGVQWNFQQNIKSRLQGLVKEKNTPLVEILKDKEYSYQRYQTIRDEIQKLEKEYTEHVQKLDLFLKGAPVDFSDYLAGKSVSLNALLKLVADPFMNQPLTNAAKNNIFVKTTKTPLVSELLSILDPFIDLHSKTNQTYRKLNVLKSQYFEFAFLQLIGKRLEETRKQEKILLISEFNDLLSKLVQGVEAPFIYDRLGYRYRHFLLDEFQDTSRMQWLNIVPLIHEFISTGNNCFIVGDPKQSIYRFKNGLAEQFIHLPGIYNPENNPQLALKSEYFHLMGEKKPILANWRSAKNIIDFNNQFFELLKSYMSEETKRYYDDHKQTIISKREGLVSVEIKPDDGLKVLTQADWILEKIKECLEDGFKLGDITILGLRNKDCSRWANMLAKNNFSVVSSDSLIVGSDKTVKLLIAYFHLRLKSHSDLARKKFISIWMEFTETSLEEYQKYIDSEHRNGKVDLDRFIIDYFKDQNQFLFTFENLYDLGNKSCALFKIDVLKNHYVHHLLDVLLEYDKTKGPDLQQFLGDYKLKGYKSAVQIPESDETIRVMTVHKSKGLEFEVVLMPKIDIEEASNNHSDWYRIEDEIIEYRTNTKEPIIEMMDYLRVEKDQIRTDGINLLYVGFTRPVERFYGLVVKKKNDFLVEALMNTFPENWDENGILSAGKRNRFNHEEALPEPNNSFHPLTLTDFIWFPKIALKNPHKIDNDFKISDAVLFGLQFHLLLSLVDSANEILPNLEKLIAEGKIDLRFKESLKWQASSIMSSVLNPIYENATRIISEQSILLPETEEGLRPDKIVIKNNEAIILEFKTGEPNPSHPKQVEKYALALTEMGFLAKTAIIYTETNKVIWN